MALRSTSQVSASFSECFAIAKVELFVAVWYIELLGIEDDLIVCNTLQSYNEQKEKATIKLMLKHLRGKGYFESFRALSKETNIQLEDPEITELYKCLIDEGDFKRVEKLMQKMIDGET